MGGWDYNIGMAKLCESAEFVFRGREADLASFYGKAKWEFLRRAAKALRHGHVTKEVTE